MIKRNLSIILAGVVIMSAFSACENTVPTSTEESEQNGKIQISMMHYNRMSEFEKLVESTYSDIDLVIEQNASATIDSESQRRLENGHGSDIIWTSLPSGPVKQYTLDLSAEDFVLNYTSSVTKQLLVDGQTRYIPLPGHYYGYVVNESLVNELGYELPKNNEDIYKILTAAKEKNIGVGANGDSMGFYNIGESYLANLIFGSYVPDFLSTPDGIIWLEDLYDGKAKFTGNFEHSMDFLINCSENNFFDSDTVMSGNSVTISNKNAVHVFDRMRDRTMVMAYGNMELYQDLVEANTNDKYTLIPFLSNENKDGWLVSIGNGYLAINKALSEGKQEEKLDAALKIFRLLSTEAGQKAWMADNSAVVSYLTEETEAEGKLPKEVQAAIDGGRVFNNALPHNIAQYFGRQMTLVISGKSTLAESMTAVDNYNRTGFDTEEQASTVVGQVSEDLIYQNYNTRKEETAIGNLIADAVKEYSGAEIALVNGGSIRSSFYKGEVWDADLAAVCPYGNKIVTVKAKGSALKAALANGISQTDRGEEVPGGRFLQVSGICYTFRPMKDENDKAELLEVTLSDGTVIDDNKEYLIAVTDYMAGSATYAEGNGDGFTMFNLYDDNEEKTAELVNETEATYRDALKSYFAAREGNTVTVKTEGRIKLT